MDVVCFGDFGCETWVGGCVGIVVFGIWFLWRFRYSFLWETLGGFWYLDASGCGS